MAQFIGIDLGTSSILVYTKDKGITINEPSVVAWNKKSQRVLAVGKEAMKMIGRTPDSIEAVKPIRDGVIFNYDATAAMLQEMIRKSKVSSFFKPTVVVCVPSGITEVEKRAVEDAVHETGAKNVHVVEEPMAAALGCGIDVSEPCGNVIVDIGGGTCDIAVISFGDIVLASSIKTAGDKFDEAIIKHMRKNYSLLIGEPTAESVKKEIGNVYPMDEILTMQVKGRDLITGLPKYIEINSSQIREAMTECACQIIDAVHSIFEKTPPELIGDIYTNGIIMTGGGSLIRGLDKLMSEKLHVYVKAADNPIECVAKGTGIYLDYIDKKRRKYSEEEIEILERQSKRARDKQSKIEE